MRNKWKLTKQEGVQDALFKITRDLTKDKISTINGKQDAILIVRNIPLSHWHPFLKFQICVQYTHTR